MEFRKWGYCFKIMKAEDDADKAYMIILTDGGEEKAEAFVKVDTLKRVFGYDWNKDAGYFTTNPFTGHSIRAI